MTTIPPSVAADDQVHAISTVGDSQVIKAYCSCGWVTGWLSVETCRGEVASHVKEMIREGIK